MQKKIRKKLEENSKNFPKSNKGKKINFKDKKTVLNKVSSLADILNMYKSINQQCWLH